MPVSRSYRAPAMLVSSSEGFWREGEFAAILLSWGEDILTAGDDMTSVEELAVKYVGLVVGIEVV